MLDASSPITNLNFNRLFTIKKDEYDVIANDKFVD